MNLYCSLCKKPAQWWSPMLSCIYCMCEFVLAWNLLPEIRAQSDLLPMLCPAAFHMLREVQLSPNMLDLQSLLGSAYVAMHSPYDLLNLNIFCYVSESNDFFHNPSFTFKKGSKSQSTAPSQYVSCITYTSSTGWDCRTLCMLFGLPCHCEGDTQTIALFTVTSTGKSNLQRASFSVRRVFLVFVLLLLSSLAFFFIFFTSHHSVVHS